MSRKKQQGTAGITLEGAISELDILLEDAEDFISSELEPQWEAAERYYKGETDLETVEGRSNVTKTEVRDAIRNTLPSVMRVLLQSRKPVVYIPSSLQHGAWTEQQAEFAAQTFWASDGYHQLLQALIEGLKLKRGVLKVSWEPKPNGVYQRYTAVPFSTVEQLLSDPLFEVSDYTMSDTQLGSVEVELFDIDGERVHENGLNRIEAVPTYEFFISRNVNSVEMAIERGVHGQRGLISVSEALEMGIPEDTDWLKLDDEDPEESDFSGSSTARRGYTKTSPNDISSVDVLRRVFLLTECYVSYDLEGTGRPQLYKFFLGGSSRTYLHHEQVEDSPYSLIRPNITPFTVHGDSTADLTMNEQDTSTSLLRALVDNAHASNGVKIAADPTKTNFDDLMNPAINAPVRKRAGDTIQTIQIPFTGQGNLATLQYLDQDVQNKTGVTKAAQGLDPDAMQSTDKNAVMNTIQTGQGQVELMVRNIIETGLVRVFRLLLRNLVQHASPIQMLQTKGKTVPISLAMFDPDAAALPNVGLGTASPMQKQAALSFVYADQKEWMAKLGENNPFTSYAQMYNTLEDMLESQALYDVGRYYNVVTPEVEKQWAAQKQKMAQEQQKLAQENQPMDPSKAFITVEAQKAELKKMELVSNTQVDANKLRFNALAKAEELDIKRDDSIAKTRIELLKIGQQAEQSTIEEKQKANERISTGTSSSGKENT